MKDTAGRACIRCPTPCESGPGLGASRAALTSAGSESAHITRTVNLSVSFPGTHPATQHIGLPRDLAGDLSREKPLYAGVLVSALKETLAEIHYRNSFRSIHVIPLIDYGSVIDWLPVLRRVLLRPPHPQRSAVSNQRRGQSECDALCGWRCAGPPSKMFVNCVDVFNADCLLLSVFRFDFVMTFCFLYISPFLCIY